MGNSSSSGRGHHDDTVDFGYLTPQGVYTGPRDWNQSIVTQLICERRLAPFYRPLEDYDESWDEEEVLAARKEFPESEPAQAESSSIRAESVNSSNSKSHHKRPSATKEPTRQLEAAIYRGAIECPICFLYYPPNINHSRCCDQAICTECFVQIKRADPTTTHLVSEPASCPYCVQENFGIVYTPPSWRAGIGSEGATPPSWPDSSRGALHPLSDSGPNAAAKRRRKSFGHDSPEVVTIDQIRPDWEAKLAAVRAAVARRANRRIIMRQVGDRLIPVGVTSGRVHALPTEDGNGETAEGNGNERGSRRSRRRGQNSDLNQFLGSMGLAGQDLEELMIMEAMRLSLIDHEESQRREREEEAKKQKEAANSGQAVSAQTQGAGTSQTSAPDSPSSATATRTEASSRARTVTPSPPEASNDISAASPGHCPSSSLSSGLSLDPQRRSPSPSPFAVGTALVSAASTANAIVSPGTEEEFTAPDTEIAPPSSAPAVPSHPGTPAPAVPDHSSFDAAAGTSSTVGPTTASPEAHGFGLTQDLPPAHGSDSLVSSVVSEDEPDSSQLADAYNVLPSRPASAVSALSQKPLLETSSASIPPTTVIIGGDSTESREV